ncbi:MAG: 50S ribosomal protein L9 [Alistipes sp.]|nr:50S ribosomal protein L9 [Rikenellaceae bacterium]MBE6193775.1 50S ribosomal protein L9 [Rikenellaceae bacterium]MBP3644648.1 50S ribosomal protein L9 [Alistipes sp.]MBQ8853468.1 50S ribosomal protein L9 [Alistipes sp.]
MEIILIKDVENLGYANDIVTVRPGYANNYLIPQGFAKAATASAKKILAENLRQRAHKDAKILADAQALAATLENLNLTFTVKAEEGRIFGSITSADVAEALAAKGVEVDKKNITVEGIKTVGEYKVAVKLHREVKAEVAISVVAEE